METPAAYYTRDRRAPETIALRKLAPGEATQPGDCMLCDGHLYPVCLYGTGAGEFDAPIYRETTAQTA